MAWRKVLCETVDILPSIAYNIDAKLRICDRGFTSKEQSRNAPGIAVPRAFLCLWISAYWV